MSEKTSQIGLRLPDAWLERVDAVASKLSRPGLPVSRSDAVRALMYRGLALYEEEFGLVKPAKRKASSG